VKQAILKTKLLQAATRSEWRAWLKRNHKSKTEIWLVYYKKHTGKPRIAYNDAVEEALCFGWIDSTVRALDAGRFAQRFSVRNPKSRFSQANIERLRALAKQGLVLKEVIATLPDLAEEAFKVPPDILAAVRAKPVAWRNFQAFSPSYVRIRVAYIQGARKRPAEFKKRLAHFLKLTEQNKQFGFGGIDKYY
jgi:uncharacterized protein YdeI (YjbR/CyaY-like superfamily)